jgi:ABC-2 type transport system permease protein
MTEEKSATHKVPSDIEQIPIIWRYELLRYLRSWRIIVSVIVAFVIIALLYIVPPAAGHPYSGTATDEVMKPIDPADVAGVSPVTLPPTVGIIHRSYVDLDTLTLALNGTAYPSEGGANWTVLRFTFKGSSVYGIFFTSNVTAYEITASYDWCTSSDSFATVFLSFGYYLIVVCAVFFAADSIAGEFQNRTGYLILPNPVKRSVLFAGKYMASLTAGLIVLGIFYGVVAGLSLVSANGIDDDLGLSFLLAAEFMMAAMAVGYFISSILKGTTGSLILTLLLFIILLPIVDQLSMVIGTKIDGSLTFSANVMTYILTDPYPTDWILDTGMGLEITMYYPVPVTAAVVMMTYTVVCLALSMVIFKRKQLAG